MKVERKLKYGSFSWDDETKKFTVEHKGQSIELNKIYAFAFLRFAFSVAQRNWFRKQEKPKSDKNIRDGKFEHEQFELPNINRKEIKDSEKSESHFKVTIWLWNQNRYSFYISPLGLRLAFGLIANMPSVKGAKQSGKKIKTNINTKAIAENELDNRKKKTR